MGHMQEELHVQHTRHIQDTGHTNEVGHNRHMRYTQCELYTQYRGQTERTVHTQNGRNPRHTCHTRDCNLPYCHHPCHAAFGTMPQLALGGPLPLLAV